MNDTQPIISTTVHGFTSVRPRFACWGNSHGFDRAHSLKFKLSPSGMIRRGTNGSSARPKDYAWSARQSSNPHSRVAGK